ncbi:autotransporter outer membrane beta-barrel domain-containing protein [Akkermansia sp. BCRC 18949]|uniref:autotransporter outer membrane beta-barrel domain-containing protein n=1 Tax=Akkermansia sp. BCRC 18949 TaxID=3037987 RepID=UPI00384E2045
MKPILPLLLRRSLLASLLVPIISLSFSASAADFMVDASQYSDPDNNIYSTLEELVSSVALVAGDTVILNNDDASLTTGLTVPVNFRSADPAALCAVDLSGLGKNPLYDLGAGEYTLEMDSVIWSKGAAGVIRTADDNVSLEITGEVQFLNNHVDNSNNSAYGGAIYMEGDHATLTLGNNATFSRNYAFSSSNYSSSSSSGGAIAMSGDYTTVTLEDNATFSGNYTFSDSTSHLSNYPSTSFGGAIYMEGDHATLTLGSNATFSGNYTFSKSGTYSTATTSTSSGGAIYMRGDHAMLTLGDNATFSGNYAYSDSSSNYSSNYSNSSGGAIHMEGDHATLTLGNNVTFSGNYASSDSSSISTSSGGAIYMQGVNSFLTIRNGAIFTNNYSSTYGGAIYLQGITTDNSSRFLAFTHDVLFSGNMTGGTFTQHNDGSFSVVNGVANAIHVDGTNHLQLAAAQGKEVRFNDPITSAAYFSSTENVTLSLNQYTDDDGISHTTDGTVIFSGELYQGDNAHLVASRYSDFKGQTTLYGGSLILEHNVVFGNAGLRDDTSMTLEHGTLEITGGSVINAASFSITNSDVVLRPGTSAFINAKNVDLSRGFVFDMQKQAQETATQANTTGLSISASDSFTLGGSIGIMDTGISADYFYADNSWKQQRTFIVLTDSNQTHTDDFSGAHSLATGSDRVDSPYAYTGSWSHQWVDVNGDGFPEQLQLVWTPAEDAAIRDILPELAGTLAMNSMWSSASNANMSRAALGNLDAQRFITGPENNYWVKGMGDFLNHASEGVRDGFDYHGGGYSVGADRRITPHAILGLGFGDLYGKMRGRSFAGDIDQQTRIGMLYGGWHKILNRENTLLVTGTAGYGWTDDKMNSFHTGGRSHGKWTNETLFGTLTGKWSRRVNETVAMEVMLGLEYTDVTQEAFTETGWDARRFEKGRLKNLSVPVGVGLTHRSELKDREWINSAMVSYVPDVYRRNPSAQAERLLNGYRWEAEGMSPDRNGVRVNVNSALQLNARWRMYAGYEFEGRSKATAHRFNAGVSYAY